MRSKAIFLILILLLTVSVITYCKIKITADDGIIGSSTEMVWVHINDSGAGMQDEIMKMVNGNQESMGGFNGYMSKYETTNAQYCQYLNAAMDSNQITIYYNVVYAKNDTTHSQPYYDLVGSGYIYNEVINKKTTKDGAGVARINWTGSSFTVDNGFENHPVTYVSWYGSTAFADYYGWRLPTWREWQAVADYDGSYIYGCGTTINNSIANRYGSNHPNGTTVVGAFGTYGYGMCDMAGNVWEWTRSMRSGSGSDRIVRGGGWLNNDVSCFVMDGEDISQGEMNCVLGFRICR